MITMKEKKKDYIKVISETKNITAAAKEIGISQPALSAYLKKKEDGLGVKLFDRSRIPIKLTESGKAYIKYLDGESKLFSKFLKEIESVK